MRQTSTTTTSRDLMRATMRRQPSDRIPTMPQICHDTPIRIYAAEDGDNWIDAMRRCVEDPAAIYDYVIRLVEDVNCDGLRLFVKPEPMRTERVGDELIVLDRASGQRIGRIDTMGGGGVVPDRPNPPVETLNDVKQRLEAMVEEFTDEKMALLRKTRARRPHRFVASAPGGITMNTYNILRGQERAMMDFFDRPDFVHAVLEMMADTGAHVVEPLDPLGGVSVADAKRRIGDRVALMGGLNTLTLSLGTPEQVRTEAIRKCREGGPYDYILAAGDMVPPDTPLENLRAMVKVAVESEWRNNGTH